MGFKSGLEENRSPTLIRTFRARIGTAFYIRYIYAIKIRKIEDGAIIVYYISKIGSPWINTFAEAESWLHEQEDD